MNKVYENIYQDFEKGIGSDKYLKVVLSESVKKANRYIRSAGDKFTSRAIDNAIYYNQVSKDRNTFSSNYTDRDDMLTELKQVYDFLSSPFISRAKSNKVVNKLKRDFRKGGVSEDLLDNPGFAEWVQRGNFSELIKAVGNSEEVIRDVEKQIADGTTYEQLEKAFSDFIKGSKGYDRALADLKKGVN